MNKKIVSIAVAGLLASSVTMQSASADVSFSGNVTLATDYLFRGISQTDGGPAIQGGFDLALTNGLYAGIWASNLDFGDDADIEIDYYAGFGGAFTDNFGYDLGLLYYSYPSSDAASDGDYDFAEVYGSLAYDFGVVSTTVGLNYSNDFFAASGNSTYLYINVDVPLQHDFALAFGFGGQSIDDNATVGIPNYNVWTIGASKSAGGFDFALNYSDTDMNEDECFGGSDICSDAVVFSVSKSM
ncbi:MAG: hypothetical protein GWO88_01155 [Planctomycetia bacterium]|nr:hypothetical protein [Planctomycetia bacterium]